MSTHHEIESTGNICCKLKVQNARALAISDIVVQGCSHESISTRHAKVFLHKILQIM
jgi:hypothetical protein